jgi:NAD(P)-dependent dehydrogenase (short-subunit alcohol dehydrogenase family)
MNTMQDGLEGRRAVITAGAGGIGLEIARTLRSRGAQVHIADIDAAALAAAHAAMSGIGATHADVSRPQDVERLFDAAVAAMGGVDVLVNNAGIAGPTLPAEDIPIADWDTVIATNVSAMFYCARRAIPLLQRAGGGSIVNVSSVAVRRGGFPLRLPYAVSKVAVHGLTETLAMELGRHRIRVNTVMPGAVAGERLSKVLAAEAVAAGVSLTSMQEEVRVSSSLRVMIAASDIAEMVAFLCSQRARHVTGQAIAVCGNFEGHRSAFLSPPEAPA